MGWSTRLVNLEHEFNNSSRPPIIANRFNVMLEDERRALNELILSKYEGDNLDTFPSCDCGYLKGAYNEGLECPKCNTHVQPVTERSIESMLWLEAPEGVSSFVSPIAWIILSRAMSYGTKGNMFEYLVIPTTTIQGTPQKDTARFLNLNIPRGINYFYEHFDEIIELLYREQLLKGRTNGSAEDVLAFIKKYRDCIFTKYIPMPSRLGMITEKTSVHSYTDTNIVMAVDALRTITGAVWSPVPLTPRMMQARAMQANKKIAEYHNLFMKDSVGGKEGLSRSHLFAGRLHHTFRAVIVSLTDNHDYDELHIPWSIAVMVLKVHILNKLFKRGFTPKQAFSFINEHIVVYNPILDEIFQELIAESPYGGIPCTFGRNPTLVRGSIQLFRITKVKTDPEVNAISLSVLAIRQPNADAFGERI